MMDDTQRKRLQRLTEAFAPDPMDVIPGANQVKPGPKKSKVDTAKLKESIALAATAGEELYDKSTKQDTDGVLVSLGDVVEMLGGIFEVLKESGIQKACQQAAKVIDPTRS